MTYTALQQIALIVLRTLIGWHFLYEGLTKLLHPAWTRAGSPATAWSSAGYLKGATGPLADVFHSLGNASWIGSLDLVIAGALVAVGLSLMLGFLTQLGCAGAFGLLSMFYLSAIPLGLPEARAEGTYLLVNKNLVEAAAVGVLFAFRTGRIAGLDRLWSRSRGASASMHEATV
jgi:thiosulfate dehydrogenase [quinone] large subunit